MFCTLAQHVPEKNYTTLRNRFVKTEGSLWYFTTHKCHLPLISFAKLYIDQTSLSELEGIFEVTSLNPFRPIRFVRFCRREKFIIDCTTDSKVAVTDAVSLYNREENANKRAYRCLSTVAEKLQSAERRILSDSLNERSSFPSIPLIPWNSPVSD